MRMDDIQEVSPLKVLNFVLKNANIFLKNNKIMFIEYTLCQALLSNFCI